MANPLQSPTPPVAPLQDQQTATPGDPRQAQPQAAAPPPPPSHEQTVAALRHFHAIKDELDVLWKNPNLGKSDIKSAIIDGATKLVATRIITPAQAVMQLGQVPDKPIDQRKWVQQQLATTMQAANTILDHHRESRPGTQHFATEMAGAQSDPSKHLEDMSGIMEHYSGKKNG